MLGFILSMVITGSFMRVGFIAGEILGGKKDFAGYFVWVFLGLLALGMLVYDVRISA